MFARDDGPLKDIKSPGPAVKVPLEEAQRWSIHRVEGKEEDDKPFIRVGNRKITIKPTPDFPNVWQPMKGKDGSFLIIRWRSTDLHDYESDSVWYHGQEKTLPISGVSVYVDQSHYAWIENPDANSLRPPWRACQSFAKAGGKQIALGPGSVKCWIPGRVCALQIPLSDQMLPMAYFDSKGVATRLIGPFGHMSFVGYEFLHAESDGTVYLQSGSGTDESELGNSYFGEDESPYAHVLECRNGKVLHHWILPARWYITRAWSRGKFLVRRAPSEKSPFNNDSRGEQDWTMGVFEHGVLQPASFSRPAGTNDLIWRNGEETFGLNALRIHVFYGRNEWFRLAPAEG
jgi:hypothetical protein